ncbi:phosphatase PAP2 family protein [Sorangium sp. So ce429]
MSRAYRIASFSLSSRARARAAALLMYLSAASGCRPDHGEVSALDVVPPPPLLGAAAAPSELPAPPADAAEQTAKEIDELLALEAQRTDAAQATAAFWQAGAVLRWNEIARGLVMKYGTNPINAARVYALLSVAQHDALVLAAEHHRRYRRKPPPAVDPRLKPLFAAEITSTYPSDHAAVASASAAVLAFVYRSKSEVASIERKAAEHRESRLLAGLSLPSDVAAGEQIGQAAAARAIARAKDDGARGQIPWNGQVPRGRGLWFSSESPAVEPLRPAWGTVRPWFMEGGDQLRPPPPPDIDSPEFAAALDEVRRHSRHRMPGELEIAQRWSDGPRTATPPGHWNEIAAGAIRERGLNEIDAARVMAYLNMVQMDAGIACWDAKYAYWLIRPSQVDPTIALPVGLPNFPSYPSGHSTFSGAAAEILGHFFPDEKARFEALAEEASLSRIYGGIHYRFDSTEGLKLGRAVARLAVEHERSHRGQSSQLTVAR